MINRQSSDSSAFPKRESSENNIDIEKDDEDDDKKRGDGKLLKKTSGNLDTNSPPYTQSSTTETTKLPNRFLAAISPRKGSNAIAVSKGQKGVNQQESQSADASSSFLSQIADKIAEATISAIPSKSDLSKSQPESETKGGFLSNFFSRFSSSANSAPPTAGTKQEQQSLIVNNSNLFTRKALSPKPNNTSPSNTKNSTMLGLTSPNLAAGHAINATEDEEENISRFTTSEEDSDESMVEYDSEEDEEVDDEEEDEDEISWIEWYCGLQGHDIFVQVEESFIDEDFNLTGLASVVPYFQEALEMIQDLTPEGAWTKNELQIIEQSAETLYCLIHQRYLISKAGLTMMHEKFLKKEFGVCPRAFCEQQALLPVGLSDIPNKETVKMFCPRCIDVYQPSSSAHLNIDGAAFGTSAAHLLFLSNPDLHADINSAWVRMYTNSSDSTGVQVTGTYEPKIYGFKIHSSSVIGSQMKWLRRIIPPMSGDTENIVSEEN